MTIGHVHLRTTDIARPRSFYVDLLGFRVVAELHEVPGWGTTGDVLFLAAGGYHHHLGFNTWPAGDPPQADGVHEPHHVAINYPTRPALADALRRLQAAQWPVRQLIDHGTHEAIYVNDPDGNVVELACNRPVDEWPRDDHGRPTMALDELDVDSLLAEPPLDDAPAD